MTSHDCSSWVASELAERYGGGRDLWAMNRREPAGTGKSLTHSKTRSRCDHVHKSQEQPAQHALAPTCLRLGGVSQASDVADLAPAVHAHGLALSRLPRSAVAETTDAGHTEGKGLPIKLPNPVRKQGNSLLIEFLTCLVIFDDSCEILKSPVGAKG